LSKDSEVGFSSAKGLEVLVPVHNDRYRLEPEEGRLFGGADSSHRALWDNRLLEVDIDL